jgi:hypothetical protein
MMFLLSRLRGIRFAGTMPAHTWPDGHGLQHANAENQHAEAACL